MAASTEDLVLSDVHVCLSNSETIGTESGTTERMKWLSKFCFHLPQEFVKIHPVSNASCPVSDRSHPVSHGSHSAFDMCYEPLEESFLELDEDGDIIVERRHTADDIREPSSGRGLHNESKGSCDISTENHRVQNSSTKGLGFCKKNEEMSSGQISLETPAQNISLTEDKSSLAQNVTINDERLDHSDIVISNQERDGQTQNVSSDKERCGQGVIIIEHNLETSIPEVGFQVWSGALLLCDYLIHNHTHLENAAVLDLGAGTGITSIVAAMFASHVLCTDYLTSIVELSERNWERNRHRLPQKTCGQISFRILDWMSDWMSPSVDSDCKYGITADDLQLIEDATLILAAEVVYDEELTDAFFQTIYKILLKPPTRSVLLTLERRIVFSAENQDICSPAYEHFQENLQDLVSVDEGPVKFTAEKLSVAFPQYFQYQRVKELELWKLSSYFLDSV